MASDPSLLDFLQRSQPLVPKGNKNCLVVLIKCQRLKGERMKNNEFYLKTYLLQLPGLESAEILH